MKPSAEEEKNGWTEETLTRYIKERALANTEVILGDPASKFITKKKPRRTRANNRYSPHHWRRT